MFTETYEVIDGIVYKVVSSGDAIERRNMGREFFLSTENVVIEEIGEDTAISGFITRKRYDGELYPIDSQVKMYFMGGTASFYPVDGVVEIDIVLQGISRYELSMSPILLIEEGTSIQTYLGR